MSDIVYLDVCCLKRPFDDTAYAEEAGARWLVTTDDQLIASGQRHRDALGVEIVNPIRLLESLRRGQE